MKCCNEQYKVHRGDVMNNEDRIKSSCRGKVTERRRPESLKRLLMLPAVIETI